MLRIEFSGGELAQVRLATAPEPMWEIALSLHLLQNRRAPLTFDPWRRAVRSALERAGMTRAVAGLIQLCPAATYFPDFLTPAPEDGAPPLDAGDALEVGLDRVLSSPKHRLHRELTKLYALRGPAPSTAHRIAGGDPVELRRLGNALRRYYDIAVAPYLPAVRAATTAERGRLAEALLTDGHAGLLRQHSAREGWQVAGSTLRVPYPFRRELDLKGRALTFVPSFFCVHAPVALADAELPPVLVHPLAPEPGWLRTSDGCHASPGNAGRPLRELLGGSRARLLRRLDRPHTTSELADALDLALSTVSRHTTVLREAGLLDSRRHGNAIHHARTSLGEALLTGAAGEAVAGR